MGIKNEGLGNLPGYSQYLRSQQECIQKFRTGFESRKEFLDWKVEFTHMIFGNNNIGSFELLTDPILEPFLFGELKDKENAQYLRDKIADTFRREYFTDADGRLSQRAQEINIPEKKNQYRTEVQE